MIGDPLKPGCDVPSIVTGLVMVGRLEDRLIVCTPLPMANPIVSWPASALASWIAARSVQAPPLVAQMPLPTLLSAPSAALFTTQVGVCAAAGALPMIATTMRTLVPRENIKSSLFAGGALVHHARLCSNSNNIATAIWADAPRKTADCEGTSRVREKGLHVSGPRVARRDD